MTYVLIFCVYLVKHQFEESQGSNTKKMEIYLADQPKAKNRSPFLLSAD